MHLRIYLWLSCVVLAGYVRATEKELGGAAAASNERELYIDDEGSGAGGGYHVDGDVESSGSGWGPDDEDAASSGALPYDDDDEDHPRPTLLPQETVQPTVIVDTTSPKTNDFGKDTAGRGSVEEPVVVKAKPVDTLGKSQDINISSEDIDAPGGEEQETPGSTVTRPEVSIMNTKTDERATSFFAQPGILAAVIGGAVVGLLCAILVVMFIVYRMRKKDEGSYALDEPKRSPAATSYGKGHNNREFYA